MPEAYQRERPHTRHAHSSLSNLYTWVTQSGYTHKYTTGLGSMLSTPCHREHERWSLHTHSNTPFFRPSSVAQSSLMLDALSWVSACVLCSKFMCQCVYWFKEWEHWLHKTHKSNSSGAQATAWGGEWCPFCPNKPHQDSWHEVWG